jgi:hypothetical protein
MMSFFIHYGESHKDLTNQLNALALSFQNHELLYKRAAIAHLFTVNPKTLARILWGEKDEVKGIHARMLPNMNFNSWDHKRDEMPTIRLMYFHNGPDWVRFEMIHEFGWDPNEELKEFSEIVKSYYGQDIILNMEDQVLDESVVLWKTYWPKRECPITRLPYNEYINLMSREHITF